MRYKVTITTVDGSVWGSRLLTTEELDENSEGILASLETGTGTISLPGGGLGTIVRAEHVVAMAIAEVSE